MRRWLGQDPVKILSPYVHEGMTVLEPGPGMGFFTLPLARMVGATGRVIAVDLQPKMIANLKRRAAKANLLERIDARITTADTMGLGDIENTVDFTLAFAVVHEFPDAAKFFDETAHASKPGALMLLAEPSGHVKDKAFAAELTAAESTGFILKDRHVIPRSQSAMLSKQT